MTWNGTTIRLRPIRPEDEAALRTFFEQLSLEDMHARYFCTFRNPEHAQLARLTQIDYAREMAFVAMAETPEGNAEILGEVRAESDPDNIEAEIGIVVRSDCTGRGLGTLLMKKIVAHCRKQGTRFLAGTVLPGNRRMLGLVRGFGFAAQTGSHSDGIAIRLPLSDDDSAGNEEQTQEN
ncbi:Peptidyl-lysine N-acetyltransferase Pat [Cupriavidus laharis]|uniref:Peptidyl-lysine N-acetyltransferase Pat n=1 Tax=Cupriavidus laharis TaxID=151654 RepID=A0ABN7XY25_9BURK|nr:GNAT family N-acetyltransferase [Cupriavidus laharis]CAG9165998.1 Peptidyl-lysine N-acetyltransferase Pat [Cupriavidus laharis]